MNFLPSCCCLTPERTAAYGCSVKVASKSQEKALALCTMGLVWPVQTAVEADDDAGHVLHEFKCPKLDCLTSVFFDSKMHYAVKGMGGDPSEVYPKSDQE